MDLNNRDDHLTIDEFAIAMRLIQRKAAGEELTRTLPLSLIPPSLRSQFAPKTSPTSPKSPINEGKPPLPPPQTGEVSVESVEWPNFHLYEAPVDFPYYSTQHL